MPIPTKVNGKASYHDEGILAKLARDATDASRHEATRSADIADVFDVVHIMGEEAFL
jgi:hypothetical protein